MFKSKMLGLLLICIIWGCDKPKKSPSMPSAPAILSPKEMEIPSETNVSTAIMNKPLGFLVTYKDKYATQENLFKNELIASRLKALDRFNYDALLETYNSETKINIIDNVVHMSGCKAKDCPSRGYEFFIDIKNDNINVLLFRSNMLKVYNEKGFIELPTQFAQELEYKKEQAKIGSIDDTESDYSID